MEKGYFHEVSCIDQEGRTKTSRLPVAQELARQGLDHLPQRFVRSQEGHPTYSPRLHGDLQFPQSISMENLRATSEPNRRTQELARLAQSAKEWGMFFVTGHGISSRLISSLEDVVKGFFQLSFEEKKKSVGSYASVDNMGYGRSFVKSDDQPLDWMDRLTMRAAPKDGTTDGLHVWPQKPSNFREVMEDFVEESRRLLDDMLQALAEAVMLDHESFLRHFSPTDSVVNVRVNYYPPCPQPDLALGLTPHTDASGLTLLMQFDSTEGLEVLKDGQWVRIPAPPESFLVGVGDFLEIMSNGEFQSPWHRAVTHRDKERFSVAIFYNPPMKEEIGPVYDQTVDIPCFKKVVVEDYLQLFYKLAPTTEKRIIRLAKV